MFKIITLIALASLPITAIQADPTTRQLGDTQIVWGPNIAGIRSFALSANNHPVRQTELHCRSLSPDQRTHAEWQPNLNEVHGQIVVSDAARCWLTRP